MPTPLNPSRLLKQALGFVLATLKSSTYEKSAPGFLACCGLAGDLVEHPVSSLGLSVHCI
jgi:hypothetical protein